MHVAGARASGGRLVEGEGSNRVHAWHSPDLRLACICAAFFLLALIGLAEPAGYLFDERTYVPAAARLALGIDVVNREHPMFGKEVIAASIALLGNGTAVWRIGPLVFGTLGIWAFSRALGTSTGSRRVEAIHAILLASNFLLFTLSRIAMLDSIAFGLVGLGCLMSIRRRFGAAGIAIGLACATKWSAAPILLLLLVAAPSFRARTVLLSVSIAAYLVTFVPGLLVDDPLRLHDLVPLHWAMLEFHRAPKPDHAAASHWYAWVINNASIWMAPTGQDGPRNVVLLAGNPLTMPLIPIALVAAAVMKIRGAKLPALAYIFLMAIWAMGARQVQYYHYYLLPSTFGLAVLALVVDRLPRWLGAATCIFAVAVFAWFYPVLIYNPASDARNLVGMPAWRFEPKEVRPAPPGVYEEMRRRLACLDFPRDCFPPWDARIDVAVARYDAATRSAAEDTADAR